MNDLYNIKVWPKFWKIAPTIFEFPARLQAGIIAIRSGILVG
jgi:hypothetical protein